jgi:hypothetical protein
MLYLFPEFSMLETASVEHKFKLSLFQPTDPKNFIKFLRKEIQLLRSSLPNGIHIKGFEDRMVITHFLLFQGFFIRLRVLKLPLIGYILEFLSTKRDFFAHFEFSKVKPNRTFQFNIWSPKLQKGKWKCALPISFPFILSERNHEETGSEQTY